jgi:hypothetical protein
MFFRKLAMRTGLMGWLIAAFAITSVPQASAAQTIFYDGLGSSGCVNNYASATIHAQRLIAHSSGTINTVNVLIGTQSSSGFSASRFVILADNPSAGSPYAGAPSTVLATFTPDSINGSGAATSAKYVGSFTFTQGTIYWIAPLQRGTAFPYCYWYPTDTSQIGMNAFHVDTSTSLNNGNWRRGYTSALSANGATWTTPMHDNLVWQFSLESNTSTPVSATLGTQSGSLKTTFRTVTPLSVSVDTPSKVTYYANGKVISGCRNVLSSAGTATCNWSPSVHGSYRIYAFANPVSTSYVASTTSTINIGVEVRTNKR